jgi:hypothetical protein
LDLEAVVEDDLSTDGDGDGLDGTGASYPTLLKKINLNYIQ